MTSKSIGLRLIIFGLVVAKLLSTPVLALASCGNINTIDSFGEAVSTPIDNCEDPFDAADSVSFSATLSLAGQAVTDGSELAIATTSQVTGSYEIDKDFNFAFSPFQLFQKQGDDLLQITAPREVDFTLEALPAGEYMAVFTYEEAPILSDAADGWWQRFITWLLPSPALASPGPGPGFGKEVLVWEFVVTEPVVEPPPPTGASSVLFLPGIMGSRLYEDADACGDNGEEERWFSASDCDQLRMQMDVLGKSLNNLYTKPRVEAIVDETFGVNVYKGILDQLEDWKNDDVIGDYRAVPYDWRLSLFDILETNKQDGKVVYENGSDLTDSYIYKSLELLASSSKSGSVSIVAHSNGGLVAKQLLYSLKANDDPLLEKVDHLILVGVPQSGTPDAVNNLLHGTKMGLGLVVNNQTSRQIINKMPFVYHLLPSEDYFDESGGLSVTSPIIEFTGGGATELWRSQYGSAIHTHEDLFGFLRGEERGKPAVEDIVQPAKAENNLLQYHNTAHAVQRNWRPAGALSVTQVGGTGVATPAALTYFTDQECVNRSPLKLFLCTEYAPKLGMKLRSTVAGDGTVVLPSALAMEEDSEVSRYWLDLYLLNENRFFEVTHPSLFESEEVLDLIRDQIDSNYDKNNYDYLSPEAVNYDDERLVFQLHSPLSLLVETPEGIVSETGSEIPNAVFRRVGEVQYVSIPAALNLTVRLTGEATGSFTLQAERWQGDVLEEEIEFLGIPNATSTLATFVPQVPFEESSLLVDYDGDGIDEVAYTTTEAPRELRVISTTSTSTEETDTPIPQEPPADDTLDTTDNSGGGNTGTRIANRVPTGQVAGIATDALTPELRQQLFMVLQELGEVLAMIKAQRP